MTGLMITGPFLLLSVLVLACCTLYLGCDLQRHAKHGNVSRPMWGIAQLTILGVFAVVLGAKLWLVRAYGSGVPYLDQWNGEAAGTYLPYLQGSLKAIDLFAPHNEHRIALPRLTALILLAANGQWDPVLQMAVNAGIHATTMAFVVATGWLLLGRKHLSTLAMSALVIGALPFGWENTLAGFQSSFYLLVLCAAVGLWLMPFSEPGSLRWTVGIVTMVTGLFTIASGVLTPFAAGIARVAVDWSRQHLGKATIATVSTCAVVAVTGALLVPAPPAHHQQVGSASLGELLVFAWQSLGWPISGSAIAGPIVWLPLTWLVITCVRARQFAPGEAWLVGWGVWVLGHLMLFSYARSTMVTTLPSRYSDILSLSLLINAVAVGVLWRRSGGPARRVALLVLLVAWIGVTGQGLVRLSSSSLTSEAPNRAAWSTAYQQNIRELYRSGDLAAFVKLSFPQSIPWPYPESLAGFLYHPDLQPILPPDIRPELASPLGVSGPEDFRSGAVAPTGPTMLSGLPVLGSFGPAGEQVIARSASNVLACREHSWLRFEVVASAVDPTLQLSLLATADQTQPQAIWTSRRHGADTILVRCPSTPFVLHAADGSATAWFGFTPPIEMASLGRAAVALIGAAPWMMATGTALLVAGVVASQAGTESRSRLLQRARSVTASVS